MGRGRIVYGKQGERYFVDDREVTEYEYHERFPSKLVAMLESGQPPSINTDSTFLAGHCNGNQFEKKPWLGDYYRARAAEAGVDTKGKVYLSSLAEEPGDPRAWVSGRGDVQKVCEERGWGCKGSVTVKRRDDVEPEPDVDVADDIVYEKALDMIEADPSLESRPAAEVLADAKQSLLPS